MLLFKTFLQYLKMDEMLEKEANLKAALASRSSVMGLLLNSTFDHDHQERFFKEQERKIAEQLRMKAEQEVLKRELEEDDRRELEAPERQRRKSTEHHHGSDKPKRSRKKSAKMEPIDEQVHLPSKREKEHRVKEEKPSIQVQQTASQLYKKMKAKYEST